MDLSNLIPSEDTITITIKHPISDEPLLKDDGKEMTITVYAPHSSQYKAVMHEQTNKRLQKASKSKRFTMTAEDIEAASLDVLSKTTKDWSIQLNGKTPKFSEKEAAEIYSKLPWLKQQILDGQEDYSAFLKN